MPPVLIAVAAAWAYSAIATGALAALGSFMAAGSLGATIAGALAAMAISYVGDLLVGKPASGNNATLRQAISSHKLVRGMARLGGAFTFAENPSAFGFIQGVVPPAFDEVNNKALYMVVTLNAHPVSSIDTIFFNANEVPLFKSNGNGAVPLPLPDGTRPLSYGRGHDSDSPFCTITKGLGTVAGDVAFNAYLSAHVGGWTPDCRQDGRAKVAVFLFWNASLFGSGIPNVSAIVRGKPVYDPRDAGVALATVSAASPAVFDTGGPAHGRAAGDLVFIRDVAGAIDTDGDAVDGEYEVGSILSASTFTLLKFSQALNTTHAGTGGTVCLETWTDNSCLQIDDFLCDPVYGAGAQYTAEIPEALLIAGANTCDEIVTRAQPTTTFTASAATDQITYDETQQAGDIQSLTQVVVSNSGGALPAPLVAGTVYYFVRSQAAPQGYLCATFDAAHDNPPGFINLTTNGTGTQTIQIVNTFTVELSTLGRTDDNSLVMFSGGLRILNGTVCRVSSSGVLPSPLAAATDYYAIHGSDLHIQLAASLDDARDGIAIVLTDVGTGVHQITATAEPRYCCNGVVDTSGVPQSAIEEMLSSMGGNLVPAGATLSLYPAVYRTPSVTLTESDLRGPLEMQALQSGQVSFNSIRGTYVDPINDWQATDFPPLQDATFIADDNGRVVWRDFPLKFTISASAAQRLRKIALRRIRREQAPKIQAKFTAFQLNVCDNFYFTNAMWGFASKVFEINTWTLTILPDQNGIPTLGVDLLVRENDPNIFAWTAAEEAGTKQQAATTLPNPFIVQPPTDLAVTSGDSTLYVRPDGTVIARAHLTWTSPLDQFVLDGGTIEIAYKLSNAVVWLPVGPPLPGSAVEGYVLDVQVGLAYDFAVRSRNMLGATSDTDDHPWQAELLGVQITGKSIGPSDVTTLTVTQNGTVVILSGSPVQDADVTAFEYRYGQSASWESMTFIEGPHARPTNGGEAASCTTAAVPSGTWWFAVKAKDTSGNYSTNAAFQQATITNPNVIIIADYPQAPGWANLDVGVTPTGLFLRHWTGVLVPDSTKLASLMTDNELWNTFNPYSVTAAIYDCPTIDLGSDRTIILAVPFFDVEVGPGDVGPTDVVAEFDYWLSAGSDTNTWATVSTTPFTARYVRVRANATIGGVTPSYAPPVIVSFTPEIEATPVGTQTGTNVAAAGGTVVNFGTAFNTATPDVTATGQGANVAWVTNITATSFKLHVGPDTTHDNGGTASWTATGV